MGNPPGHQAVSVTLSDAPASDPLAIYLDDYEPIPLPPQCGRCGQPWGTGHAIMVSSDDRVVRHTNCEDPTLERPLEDG
jgi:hypothetical protein